MSLSFDPSLIALPRGHFIGGEWVDAKDGIDLHRPSDAAAFAACPVGDASLVDRAVAAAKAALAESGWGRLAPRERARALHRWADLIEAEAETLARLEAVASTRPISELMAGDVPVTAEQIRFFAEFADKEGGNLVPTGSDSFGMIATEPYGVVGAITPWNFPINMAGWKLGPALAAGNAVVLKPSEMTPFATLYLAELSVRAGLPAGLVNIVLGDGRTTGTAITGHPDIAKVSFTGSTAAGAAIMENIARTGIKPMTLELGGKSPQLVFADADLDAAVPFLTNAIIQNAGQTCSAGSRLLVDAKVYDDVLSRVAEKFTALRVGSSDMDLDLGPVINKNQKTRVEGFLERAAKDGLKARAQGKIAPNTPPGGYYVAPTLVADVPPQHDLAQNEVFGPVLAATPFKSEEEAVRLANGTEYGLVAGVWTRDGARQMRLAKAIKTGQVFINNYGAGGGVELPFGGVRRSGFGREKGFEALYSFSIVKTVAVKHG